MGALVSTILDHFDQFRLSRGRAVVAFGGGSSGRGGIRRGHLSSRGRLFARAFDADRGDRRRDRLEGRDQPRRIRTGWLVLPPVASLLDYSFLRTLPARHLRNGLAEVIKLGIAVDGELFSLVERHGLAATLSHFQGNEQQQAILDRSVSVMLAQLESNPFESSLDRLVDFGHTFSPLIEMRAHDDLLHGEAVAIDMALCAMLSNRRGWLDGPDLDRILRLMKSVGLPIYWNGLSDELLGKALQDTTIHRGGRQRVPLPRECIGQAVIVDDISAAELGGASRALRAFV